MNSSVIKLDNAITENGSKLEGHKNIISIKGIGDKGAAILLSIIGDINDFSKSGKLASYFGIVPRVHNSADTNNLGELLKREINLVEQDYSTVLFNS